MLNKKKQVMKIEFKKLNESCVLPKYATNGSAGMDLVANNFKILYEIGNQSKVLEDGVEELTLIPNARVLVGCGFAVAIPEGYEMQIRPRSGLALKQGLTVLNTPGTIDSDYRLEVGVILINHSSDAVIIKLGDRIAQAVITSYEKIYFDVVNTLSETTRIGGFGSTGN